MMGKGHAVSGAVVWLAGWSWPALAGMTRPHADVLVVGSLVAAGAALLPDFDHPESRLANAGGPVTKTMAHLFGYLGRNIHHVTKLPADRPDEDGHRTITHTFVFALLAGLLPAGTAKLGANLAAALNRQTHMSIWDALAGRFLTALLVFAFVKLGFAAARAAFPGRQKKVRVGSKGRRKWRKATLVALGCALTSYVLLPDRVWWLGVAITVGCVAHCLGDVITASGCPILWPIPIPSREKVYNRKTRQKEPVTRWRTWYLVGTPRWMRFRVGSKTEARVTWGIVGFGVFVIAVLIYARGWVPAPTS
jgi:membrane-bound metal-dependent hydrolase YbcI (DUF457 family)